MHKILLPPLHIKLDIKKQSAKALTKNENCLIYQRLILKVFSWTWHLEIEICCKLWVYTDWTWKKKLGQHISIFLPTFGIKMITKECLCLRMSQSFTTCLRISEIEMFTELENSLSQVSLGFLPWKSGWLWEEHGEYFHKDKNNMRKC